MKDPQSFNRYSYAMNSPYKYTDQLGLLPETGCSAEHGSCSESDGKSEGERQYEAQVDRSFRNARDSQRAQEAANSGNMDAYWEIIDGNDDLSAQDQNGNEIKFSISSETYEVSGQSANEAIGNAATEQ